MTMYLIVPIAYNVSTTLRVDPIGGAYIRMLCDER